MLGNVAATIQHARRVLDLAPQDDFLRTAAGQRRSRGSPFGHLAILRQPAELSGGDRLPSAGGIPG